MATRERILEAALACFVERGYDGTTVAAIQERSGVSNGAMFHHFASKEAIAGALYVDAMRSLQEGHHEHLRQRPRSLRAAVRGAIAHQLQWTQDHADRARFLYARGHLDPRSPAGAELAELNAELAAAYRAWMAPYVERGEARELPLVVLTAVVTGPAHAVAQRWLAGQLAEPLTAYVDDLADAATAALATSPTDAARRARPVAAAGRIRVELLDEDGAVLSRAETTAELVGADADQLPR